MNEQQNSNGIAADIKQLFDPYSREDWQAIAEKSLRGNSVANLAHITASSLSVNPLYTSRPECHTELPVEPLRRWDNRLAVLGESTDEQNRLLLAGLQGGVSSAQIYLNSPEQSSPVDAENLRAVLKDVQLNILPVSLMAGSNFTEVAAKMESLWSDSSVTADQASGSFNADPIGLLATSGSLSTELPVLLKNLCSLSEHVSSTFPKVTPVSVNACCYHNAGASIEQELVACIATATEYMQAMLNYGLSEQQAHDAIAFQLACDADTLTNVVKLRTLRMLWHYVASHMGVDNPSLRVVIETSRRMQSVREPWVNHLRNVSAASAAAMGGAQSIVIHPHNHVDGAFVDHEIEQAARVARNIPIILSEESAMNFVHDPMGGSYAVENLTSELSDRTWDALQQLEQQGGLVKCLHTGEFQAAISEQQKRRILRLKDEQDIQIAVNRYTNDDHPKPKSRNNNSKQASNALLTIRDEAAYEVAS